MVILYKKRDIMSTTVTSSLYQNLYPVLVDLHTHSISSGHGSTDTINDIARTAANAGLQILGISEHGPATSGSVKASYFRSLKLANRKRFHVSLLYGVELNIINTSGDVDLEDEVLCEVTGTESNALHPIEFVKTLKAIVL